jgi:hypothetical protein
MQLPELYQTGGLSAIFASSMCMDVNLDALQLQDANLDALQLQDANLDGQISHTFDQICGEWPIMERPGRGTGAGSSSIPAGATPYHHRQTDPRTCIDSTIQQDPTAIHPMTYMPCMQPASSPSGSSSKSDMFSTLSENNSPDGSVLAGLDFASGRFISPDMGNISNAEERLKYVAEHAKLAGFSDMDTMITVSKALTAS